MKRSEKIQEEINQAELEDKSDMAIFKLHGKKKREFQLEMFLEYVKPIIEEKGNLTIEEHSNEGYKITNTDTYNYVIYYPKSQKLHEPSNNNRWLPLKVTNATDIIVLLTKGK